MTDRCEPEVEDTRRRLLEAADFMTQERAVFVPDLLLTAARQLGHLSMRATPAGVEALRAERDELSVLLDGCREERQGNARAADDMALECITLRARVAELERALQDIIADAAVPQELYDKIGPTWTGKDGHEYADMSYVLDKCAELSEVARAALSPAAEQARGGDNRQGDPQ